MTVEEYFNEWWTTKELPENGFNKTALLDFAEMYHKQELQQSNVKDNHIIHEHCPYKDKPCNYTGRGWYDRCAWCKDNNSFIRKTNDKSKPF